MLRYSGASALSMDPPLALASYSKPHPLGDDHGDSGLGPIILTRVSRVLPRAAGAIFSITRRERCRFWVFRV
jgi:hypothetical protein